MMIPSLRHAFLMIASVSLLGVTLMANQTAPSADTPASPSEVLASSVALLLRIDRLEFTPWAPESGGLGAGRQKSSSI